MWLLPLLLGCKADFRGLRVRTLDAAQTVVEVRWRKHPGEVAAVEYGDGFSQIAPALDDGDEDHHRVLVLGLPQLEDLVLRPVLWRDGERVVGEVEEIQTGLLPPDMPDIELSGEGEHAGGFVLTSTVANPRSVIILDRAGRIVWYYVPEEPLVAVDPEVNRFGDGLWLPLTTAEREEDRGVLRRVSMDGEVQEEVALTAGHHVFEQIDGDRFVYLAMDMGEGPEGQPAVGDAVTMLHRDGSRRVLWSSWDDFTWDGVEEAQEEFYPQGYDFTHGNGLFYDAERGSVLYSTRNLATLVELDIESGAVLGMMGEEGGTTFVPDSSAFSHQHCPTRTVDDTLLVFDNGDPDKDVADPPPTRIREYEEGEGTLTELRSFGLRQNLSVAVLGCAERLPNGNTLSDWGSSGELAEFDEAGEIVWRMSARAGVVYGNTSWVPDIYALVSTVPLP